MPIEGGLLTDPVWTAERLVAETTAPEGATLSGTFDRSRVAVFPASEKVSIPEPPMTSSPPDAVPVTFSMPVNVRPGVLDPACSANPAVVHGGVRRGLVPVIGMH